MNSVEEFLAIVSLVFLLVWAYRQKIPTKETLARRGWSKAKVYGQHFGKAFVYWIWLLLLYGLAKGTLFWISSLWKH